MDEPSFSLTLIQDEGWGYTAHFDGDAVDPILIDQPVPLGKGRGPDAVRLLGAAVGGCLSASLQSCLQRAHVDVERMQARVEGKLFRNRDGRLRVSELQVVLEPRLTEEQEGRVWRCVDLFEDFCTVAESVRNGFDVRVEVRPRFGGGVAEAEKGVPASAG